MAKKKAQQVTFYNKYNRHQYNSPGTDTGTEHEVQPGQSFTIAEMIRMSVRGDIPPLAMSAFHGVNVDIDEYGDEQAQDLTDIENKVEELKGLKQKAAAAKAEREHQVKAAAKQRSSEADSSKAEAATRTRQAADGDSEHDS